MKLITVDGAKCLGKSTLAKNLATVLGWELIQFPEYNSSTGKEIYDILHQIDSCTPGYYQELQHNNKVDKFRTLDPRGNYVVDGWILTEFVYSLANGLDEDELEPYRYDIQDPDVAIILRGKPLGKDSDIFSGEEIQTKVQELFCREATKFSGNRVYVSNEGKSAEEVFEFVLGQIKGVLF